jgi:hypothetical protein
MIGSKWKALESEKKRVFEDRAKKEKDRYAAELAIWRVRQQDTSDHERSKQGGDIRGLDAIAPATSDMVCNQMESEKLALWRIRQQDKSDDERSKQGGDIRGFDVIAPATSDIFCNQMESEELLRGPAIEARSSDELILMLADELHRRKIRLLQQSPESPMVEYLCALREQEQRQRENALLGVPRMGSFPLEYSAITVAKSFASNAILRQFQTGQVHNTAPTNTSLLLQAASRDFDHGLQQRLSQFTPMAAAMHHVHNRLKADKF